MALRGRSNDRRSLFVIVVLASNDDTRRRLLQDATVDSVFDIAGSIDCIGSVRMQSAELPRQRKTLWMRDGCAREMCVQRGGLQVRCVLRECIIKRDAWSAEMYRQLRCLWVGRICNRDVCAIRCMCNKMYVQ